MEDNIENNKVKIKVSEIISKCKRREDWINFSRELGKSFINYFRFILPKSTGVRWKIFYTIFDRFKKSKIYMFNILALATWTRYWIFISLFFFRSFLYQIGFS